MKWIYFSLGLFAACFAVLFAVEGSPKDKPEGLRVCVTASVVNFGIFYAIRWGERRKSSQLNDAK